MKAEKDEEMTVSVGVPGGEMSDPIPEKEFTQRIKSVGEAMKINPALAEKVVGLANLKDKKKEVVDQYNADIKEREAEITSMAREILDGQGNLFKK